MGIFDRRLDHVSAVKRMSILSAGVSLLLGCGAGGAAPVPQDGIPIVGEAPAEPCGIPEAGKAVAPGIGGVVVVVEPARYPCRIVAVPLGIELRSSLEGDYPEPARLMRPAIDSRGRIYTPAQREPYVLVWDSSGVFIARLGGSGRGPGEFASPPLGVLVGAGDTIYAYDRETRWNVFGPDGALIRAYQSQIAPFWAAHLTAENEVLLTRTIPGPNSESVFHTFDTRGRYLRSGAPSRIGGAFQRPNRPSALSPEGTLWTVPSSGSPFGMIFEEWTTDGELRRTVQRAARWLPLDGYPNESLLIPDFKTISVDGAGRLWVSVVAMTDPPPRLRSGDEDHKEITDLRYEVIDPRGHVLASAIIDSIPGNGYPPYPVPGADRLWFITRVDSLGLPTISFYRLHLEVNGRGGKS